MQTDHIMLRVRRDTHGRPSPVKHDGQKYKWFGTRYLEDGTPIESAWGHTAADVLKQITPTPF
jgi:hypothetical protein